MRQSTALEVLRSGASTFITGAPGAGKTYLLSRFIDEARAQGKSVAVTASTGIAATHLQGRTIHSWSGIGVSQTPTPTLLKNIRSRRGRALRAADILVIDEISMLPAWFFDLLDQVLRHVRRVDEPFGGLQLVVSGDFFQLPPVVRHRPETQGAGEDDRLAWFRSNYTKAGLDPDSFVTDSFIWHAMDLKVCYLTEQHRQKGGGLLSVLTDMRAGTVGQDDHDLLEGRVGVLPGSADVAVTLFPTNRQADGLNAAYLEGIDAPAHVFDQVPSGPEHFVRTLRASVLAPEHLELRAGAVVMALRNDPDHEYANGSLGRVVGFARRSGYPIVDFENGSHAVISPVDWKMMDGDIELASISQIPLRCAWAITIHKSQGMTLDAAVMDLRRSFSPGMGYVALSRVEGLDGLYLHGISPAAWRVSNEAVRLDARLRARSHLTQEWSDRRAKEQAQLEQAHIRDGGFDLGL
jgi:ATP-dependent exoDNAse (exonuclease V) alpha subunit